jgi:hypothetical protein
MRPLILKFNPINSELNIQVDCSEAKRLNLRCVTALRRDGVWLNHLRLNFLQIVFLCRWLWNPFSHAAYKEPGNWHTYCTIKIWSCITGISKNFYQQIESEFSVLHATSFVYSWSRLYNYFLSSNKRRRKWRFVTREMVTNLEQMQSATAHGTKSVFLAEFYRYLSHKVNSH